jgi:L-histidine N-alpha-methyltransferase
MREGRVTGATVPGPAFTVLLGAGERRAALERDVRRGLAAQPKQLPPKWHYDEEGSRLFDEITRLPEYYLTRTERSILRSDAADIGAHAGADTLVELGAGTSEKTRLLLDAMRRGAGLRRIVVLDVDEATLAASAAQLAGEYPEADVHAVVGDIERHLAALPGDGRRLVAFLGSSIGNFAPAERLRLFAQLAAVLRRGESFLVGVDLVKDVDRLEAAYDDAAGVTARFSLNVLAVLNRELDADFDLDAFRHVAFWDAENEWIDIRLRSLREQRVHVRALDLEVAFAAGEELHSEISAKFRRDGIERELAAAGLEPAGWWSDPAGDFGLSLSRPSN